MDFDATPPGIPHNLIPPDRNYTIEEAARIICEIQLRLMAVEDYRLRLNWCFGLVVSHTTRPRRGKVKIIQQLVRHVRTKYGVRVNLALLYQCEKLYKLYDGELSRFETWIRGNKILLGRPIYWNDVLDQLLGGRNNPKIIGQEEADRRDYFDAELAINAIERIVIRAFEGEEEAVGVLEGIRQTIEGLAILPNGKQRSVRDERYLAFVRRYGCLICERPSEAHHAFGHRGQSLKASDYACVPLCRAHHDEVHRFGAQSAQEKYGVRFLETAFNLFHRYATGNWLTIRMEKIS